MVLRCYWQGAQKPKLDLEAVQKFLIPVTNEIPYYWLYVNLHNINTSFCKQNFTNLYRIRSFPSMRLRSYDGGIWSDSIMIEILKTKDITHCDMSWRNGEKWPKNMKKQYNSVILWKMKYQGERKKKQKSTTPSKLGRTSIYLLRANIQSLRNNTKSWV